MKIFATILLPLALVGGTAAAADNTCIQLSQIGESPVIRRFKVVRSAGTCSQDPGRLPRRISTTDMPCAWMLMRRMSLSE